MNILPLATAAATAIAFSAAPSANAFQAAVPETRISEAEAAKLFRAIAPLVGTRWNDGTSETYSIAWKQPGQILLIRREGLFGTYETMVMPSADKKALRYLSHNVGAGSFGDVVVKGSGKLLLENSPRRRLECKNKNGKLQCQESTSDNGRWTAAGQRVLSPTSEAGAKALVAKLPAQYPDLPTGSFDPALGVLSAMQGHWRGDTTHLFVEIGRDAKGPTVHLGMTDVPSRSLLFRAATPGGKLIADRAYPTEQNPAGRATVELAVQPSGKIQACGWQGKLKFCYDIWLSADRDLALLQYRNVVSPYPIDYTLGITRLMKRLKPTRTLDFGLLASLDGRSFMTKSGQLFQVQHFGGGSVFLEWFGARDLPLTYCSGSSANNKMECTNNAENAKSSPKYKGDGRDYFVFGDAEFRLSNDGSLIRTQGGTREVWQAVSPGTAAFIRQRGADAEKVQRARNLREQTRRANARFWSQLNSSIASIAADYGTQMASNPAFGTTDWSARLSNTSAASPAGYASSMGSSVTVALPKATPEQLRMQDEWARYQVRRELYGETAPSTSRRASRSPDNAPPAAKAAERELHVYCYTVRKANVLRADPQSPGQKYVEKTIAIFYSSRFGTMPWTKDYGAALERLGRQFAAMLPPVSNPAWYVTVPGSGTCVSRQSWDDLSYAYKDGRDFFLTSNKSSSTSVETIEWTPG